MITALTTTQPFEGYQGYGDIIYGKKYINGYLTKEVFDGSKKIHLGNFGWQGHLSWNILERIFKLVNVAELRDAVTYECPWSKNEYFYWYPEWLFLNDLDFYKKYIHVDDMFWDTDFMEELYIHSNEELKSFVDVGKLARTFLGHGYNQYTMPNDGGGRLREFVVKLDNGDYLFGHGWEWYNK